MFRTLFFLFNHTQNFSHMENALFLLLGAFIFGASILTGAIAGYTLGDIIALSLNFLISKISKL